MKILFIFLLVFSLLLIRQANSITASSTNFNFCGAVLNGENTTNSTSFKANINVGGSNGLPQSPNFQATVVSETCLLESLVQLNATLSMTVSSPVNNSTFVHAKIPVVVRVNKPTSFVVYSLDNKPNTTITSNFNLTIFNVAKHNITIYANDSLGTNVNSGKIIFKTCVGDLNGSGKIDIIDLSLAALAYGSKAGNPKYNFAADIDEDGDVDIFDLSAMAVNYGKTCP